MKTIVRMIFGSELYGTNSELSDRDYKGIYVPSVNDCVLGNVPKSINKTTGKDSSKNTSEDTDEETYSLQYFMKLAIKGEMIVLDMLHAPDNMILESSDAWDYIRRNRSMFYTKDIKGYIGYIRGQVAKYGFKGTRLAVLEEVMAYLVENSYPTTTIKQLWDGLPDGEFIDKTKTVEQGGKTIRIYEVCGKKLHETVKAGYLWDVLKKYYDSFGERAQAAKENKGIDWKAVSHAFRACDQLIEIYTTGDLKYPLKNAQFIKDVKYGKYHFVNDNLSKKLEEKLELVEELAKKSNYPEKINQDWIDKTIIDNILYEVEGGWQL